MRALSNITVAVALLAVVLNGCAKKPAKSTAPSPTPAPVETLAPADALPEPESPPAPMANPLDGDLDAVNRYVYEEGIIGDVFYDYDRDELRDDARSRLQRNAEFMKAHPQFAFTLEGHCDERGSIGYNVALGDRRVASAKRYLSSLDVASERMQAVSYGKERPFCTESNEYCRSQNRRTHFIITGRR